MPIFLIYSFIYPTIILNSKLLILAICSYLIFCFVNYTLNLIIVCKEKFKIYLKDYFALIFSIMLTGIGPAKSFFLKEKRKLHANILCKGKIISWYSISNRIPRNDFYIIFANTKQ